MLHRCNDAAPSFLRPLTWLPATTLDVKADLRSSNGVMSFAGLEQALWDLKGRALGHVYTLLVVVLGFTLFRADSLAQAGAMFSAMFAGFALPLAGTETICSLFSPVFVLSLVFAVLLCFPIKNRITLKSDTLPLVGAVALLLLCILNQSSGSFNPFIYFRF